MGAAFMVSYTRAKSEGLGFTAGTGMAAVGIMPREVRLVIRRSASILAGHSLGTPGPRSSRSDVILAGWRRRSPAVQRIARSSRTIKPSHPTHPPRPISGSTPSNTTETNT